ncbi:MAG: sensor histidine kinase [Rhodothermales bacterium]
MLLYKMKEMRRNKLMLMVVIGLVALLPILATLQYRWIGQLSNGEVERLRTNLQTSAELFGRAVNNELSPAQFAFRVSFTGSLDQISRELSLNYQYWASRVSRPNLIDHIYWIDYDADQNLQLHEFDPADGNLTTKEWPDELMGWKQYFLERNRQQIEQYNPQISRTPSTETFGELGQHVMAETPAIAIPVSIDDELSSSELFANLNATSSGKAGHTLLTLNKKYLNEVFFPELRQEFLKPLDNMDVLIVSNGEPEKIIYKSNPSLTLDMFGKPDAETDMARLRWSRFASASRLAFGYASLMDRDQNVADSIFGQFQRAWRPGAIRDSFIVESPTLQSDFPLQAIIRLAEEDNYQGELTAEDLLVALTNLTRETAPEPSRGQNPSVTPTVSVNASPQYAWTLRLRHKTGSLEASVEANRRRNLGMSFGILLILGIATVLIYRSSRRAQWLADQQMSFVTGVSHELRTPLAVIKSAADNLADGVVNKPERMQKYGQLIRKESNRLNEMVEQILELAGVLSQNKSVEFQLTSIDDLVEEALEVYEEPIQSASFKVDLKLASDLPQIKGDKHTLKVALCNLLNNALKYSKDTNRWIGIETALHSNGKGKEIQLSVSDKGLGIPQEDLPYIFEDFFRGPSVRDAQIKGNGIGLSIVKKTMDAHNGKITVKSDSTVGTTFTLHLPVK